MISVQKDKLLLIRRVSGTRTVEDRHVGEQINVIISVTKAAGVAWWSSALTPSAQEGACSMPNPRTPFPTLGIGCFTPLPGSGWQVLFDSQLGSIGSEKSDTLQKMVAGQPEPNAQKRFQ
jgi:hypothetical protein